MKLEILKTIAQKGFMFFKKRITLSIEYLKTSWKSAIVIIPTLLVLYYLLGSLLTENIDRDIHFEIKKQERGYTFVQTAADLINREIDTHMFTPNLPFIFPAYILDNMPSFQNGVIESLSHTIHQISDILISPDFQKADVFLSYPSNVWLFSKTKDFKLEPSSTAQYRKARRNLLRFNKNAQKNPRTLIKVLQSVEEDLIKTEQVLTKQIDLKISFKSDDVFYNALGHLYSDYLLLKSVALDMPFDFLCVQKPLEKALSIDPLMIQNGDLDAIMRPNHLVELAYFTLKSRQALNSVLKRIDNAN